MASSNPLISDWITIGTASPTVDGRVISEEMLNDIAANYDPDEYTAVISSDHLLWLFGNYGDVREVRTAQDSKNRTVLQARIRPNHRLVEMNAEGQRLFSSMEVDTDFLGSGRSYLVGLAVTDQPASVGTTEIRFSRSDLCNSIIADPVEFCMGKLKQRSECRDSTLKKFFRGLSASQKPYEISNFEAETMKEEHFKHLVDLHEEQMELTRGIFESLNHFSVSGGDKDESESTDDEGKGKDEDGGDDEKDGESLEKVIEPLMSFVESLDEKLKIFEKKIDGAMLEQEGTKVPLNTGTSDQKTFV